MQYMRTCLKHLNLDMSIVYACLYLGIMILFLCLGIRLYGGGTEPF
jgi:hypothetical protein